MKEGSLLTAYRRALEAGACADLPAILRAVQWRESLTSTNSILREAAICGAREGLLLMADQQTAGRGSNGRSFYSPPSAGLYMSLLLRPNVAAKRLHFVTAAVALAVRRCFQDAFTMDLGIKWMNDLLLNDRKVGGILTETRLASNGEARAAASSPFVSFLVIGVGLNLYESGSAFPSDLVSIAGAIFSGSAPERERLDALRLQIAAGVWAAFTPLYYEILHAEEGRPPAGFVEAYREASVILGRSLDYEASPGAEKLRGVCVDIDERCRPVLRLPDDGQICVESGRLFLRAQQPQPGAEQT